MHGLITGHEWRQQPYTYILTRGRTANHLYLSVVGDGDPHSVIRPDGLLPRIATELHEQILARDATPQSASTVQREQQDTAARLAAAAARYLDAIHLARRTPRWPRGGCQPRPKPHRLLNGLTREPTWPTLRTHLMLQAAAGADPVAELRIAAARRDLTNARDQAAVIDWRIEVNQVDVTHNPEVAGSNPAPAKKFRLGSLWGTEPESI